MNPRIYVANLEAYNNGHLIGEWIDAAQTKHQILAEIEDMLDGKGEEWAIHDYDDMPDLGEWPDLETVSTVACLMEKHGDAVTAFIKFAGVESLDRFQDAYYGEFGTDEEAVIQIYEDEVNKLPEFAQIYFDWESLTRDVMIDTLYTNNGYYFFRNF